MYNFSVPDICDEFSDIQIGDLFLNSYGSKNKFQAVSYKKDGLI